MANYDVAIIGAGAAGLAAAAALVREGYSVAVVEARDRFGGRIYTVNAPGAVMPIELGADFVHGRPAETFALVTQAGVRLYEQSGQAWNASDYRQGDHDADDSDDEDDEEQSTSDVGAIYAAIDDWHGEDISLDTLLDERFAGPRWLSARQEISQYVEGFDAAEIHRVSVAWLQQCERAANMLHEHRQFRVLDGYGRLLDFLSNQVTAAGSSLHLQQVVREVSWQRGHITLHLTTPAGTPLDDITARAAVITLPLGVLKRSFVQPDSPGAVRLTPEPPEKREILSFLEMGHALKVVLQFRDVFWDPLPQAEASHQHPEMPRLSFLFSDDPMIRTWWTMFPVVAPMLTAWAAGPRAARLASATNEEIVAETISSLARTLGISRSELADDLLVGSHFHNWSTDPYSSGGYSYVAVGGVSAPAALAAPVEDTLFFAGEATNDDGNSGTVYAALASGYAAAREITRTLRP